MATLRFGTKSNKYKGMTPTHWTYESMKHCTSIGGCFPISPTEAAIEKFNQTHLDSDGYSIDYVDGADLFSGPYTIDVYGLVKDGNWYYWTGAVKSIKFNLQITEED